MNLIRQAGGERLFGDHDLRRVKENQIERLKQAVFERPESDLANVEDVVEELSRQFAINHLILREPELLCEPKEGQFEVMPSAAEVASPYRNRPITIRGFTTTFVIPFDGDPLLFKCQASTYTTSNPVGTFYSNELRFAYEHSDKVAADELRRRFESDLGAVKQHLAWIERDLQGFNDQVRRTARAEVQARQRKLGAMATMVSSLGIPLRTRTEQPPTYAVRPKPKRLAVERRPAARQALPEPVLPDADYEHVLEILFDTAIVMERSPKTFAKLDEEEIRDHLLLQLNGHYEGTATGETFNGVGKTDIMIRHEGRNLFIAECKFWKGPKHFTETIDQMLGYTTWRDTKTAVLVFNRGVQQSTVLDGIKTIVPTHSCFLNESRLQSARLGKAEGVFSYTLHRPADPDRHIHLTVIVFQVPAER